MTTAIFRHVFLVVQLIFITHAQIAEIASLASSIIAPQILGPAAQGAASAGTGALGAIGTLYQLAQNALQLTGTGVGILNQASEGKWFSLAAENLLNTQREMQDRLLTAGALPGQLPRLGSGLGGTGSLGGTLTPNRFPSLGVEEAEFSKLGKQFPAPDPDDYDTNEQKSTTTEHSIIAVTHTDPPSTQIPTETTSQEPITLFPDEILENITETKIEPSIKENSIASSVDGSSRHDEDEYYDEVTKEFSEDKEPQQIINENKSIVGKASQKGSAVDKKIPNLKKLVELLRESNLKDADLEELILQLKRNVSRVKPVVAPKRQFATNNVDKKSFLRSYEKPDGRNSKEDSDLLKVSSTRTSKVTIDAENMNKKVGLLTLNKPLLFRKLKSRARNMDRSVPRAVSPYRAFSIRSQQRSLPSSKRVYPRRTAPPILATPPPMVDTTREMLTPTAYNHQSPYNPYATQIMQQQQQQQLLPLQTPFNDYRNTNRTRSAWNIGTNVLSPPQPWLNNGALFGLPSLLTNPLSAPALAQPFNLLQSQPIPQQLPLLPMPNTNVQLLPLLQPIQPSVFPDHLKTLSAAKPFSTNQSKFSLHPFG
ncbi:unnamed protein product [Anisakis simplex]|uniref:Uncharacterized protein n=1 Tax=Anisakis simplex TaxID=6269 RepID=A0A158PP80_ANISI|nr:unnamed protein product [Anisakis simplex]